MDVQNLLERAATAAARGNLRETRRHVDEISRNLNPIEIRQAYLDWTVAKSKSPSPTGEIESINGRIFDDMVTMVSAIDKWSTNQEALYSSVLMSLMVVKTVLKDFVDRNRQP